MAAIHAFLVITLRANQIVSGLALTIFAGGLGLSAYFGTELGFSPDLPRRTSSATLDVLGLGDLPVVGPIVFDQSALVYASWGLDAPRRALPGSHALGPQRPRRRRGTGVGRRDGHQRHPVPLRPRPRRRRVRRCRRRLLQPLDHSRVGASGDTLVGGAGWIAIALVIFAFWRAELCLVGAYLFGALSALPVRAPGSRGDT